jgi:hypothetical protein
MLFSLYLFFMNKVRNVIYLYNAIDWIFSFAGMVLSFNFFKQYTKNELLAFLFSLACFISFKIAFYLLKDSVLEKLYKDIENVELVYFQLKDIVVRPHGEESMMFLTFVTLGKEFKIKIKVNKKIGVYREITYGTVRLKTKKFYNISFIIKKYANDVDYYAYHKEPIEIDHMRFEHYEDFSIKEKKSIKPTLYIVK